MNLMFYFDAKDFSVGKISIEIASWGFVAGAISMPICCIVMAHVPKLRPLFVIPVGSLITAAALTFLEVIKL